MYKTFSAPSETPITAMILLDYNRLDGLNQSAFQSVLDFFRTNKLESITTFLSMRNSKLMHIPFFF